MPSNKTRAQSANTPFILFFSLFIIGTPLCFYSSLMDAGMLSKFMFASVSLLPLVAYAFWKKPYQWELGDSIISLLLVLYFLSITWAQNIQEACFASLKVGLFFVVYIVLKQLLRQVAPPIFTWIFRTLGIVSVLIGLATLVQFVQVMATDSGNMLRATYEVKLFFGHKNLLCSFLFLLLPFQLMAYQQNTHKTWKYLYLFNCLLILIIPLLLLCRSVFMALLVSGISWSIWQYRRHPSSKKQVLRIGSGIVVVFVGLIMVFSLLSDSQTFLSRFNPASMFQSFTAQERFLIWEKNAALIQQKGILGVGAGNWFIEFPSNGIETIPRMAISNKVVVRPHNDYLWVWTEVGIGGLLLLLAFWCWHIVQAIRYRKTTTDVAYQQRAAIALFAFLGYLLISFLDFPRERVEHQLLVALLLLFMLPISHESSPDKSTKKPTNTWKNYGLLTICYSLLAACLLVGFYRVKGEIATQQLYQYNAKKNYAKVAAFAQKAKNPFYSVDPLSYPLNYWYGFSLARQNKREEAVKALEASLIDNPYHYQLLSNLGLTHLQLRHIEKAEKYLLASHKINSQYKRNSELLALMYYTLKRYGEARKFVQLVRQSKSPDATAPEFEEMVKKLEQL